MTEILIIQNSVQCLQTKLQVQSLSLLTSILVYQEDIVGNIYYYQYHYHYYYYYYYCIYYYQKLSFV